jgi:hypothetical protein
MPEHGVFTVRVRLELAPALLIEPQIRQTATGGEQGDAIQPELMYFPISETGRRLLAPFSRAASARRAFCSSVMIPPFRARIDECYAS